MELEGRGVAQECGSSGEEGRLCPATAGSSTILEGGASPGAFSVPALATGGQVWNEGGDEHAP